VRSLGALLVLLCASCRFGVHGVPIDSAGDDLAVAASDLGAAAPPDFATDPCGPARLPSAGRLAVRCVIGTSPILDGNLADWGALDYTLTHANAQSQSSANAWTGKPVEDDADSSAQMSLRWDLTYLWVAMHVDDDIRGLHPNAANYQPYLDDAVELYVDGLADRTAAYGADDHQFVVTADGHNGEYKNGSLVGAVPVADFAVQPDATGVGFSVELRVPWSVLGGAAVANGRALGVDFEVDDDDNTTIQELTRYLTWWNMSSTGCNYPPACTSNFGAAQLVGR